MPTRIRLFLLLVASLTMAFAQQATQPEDSSPPAKADSKSSRPHIRLGGVFLGVGYTRYSGFPDYGYYPGYWPSRPYLFDPWFFSPFARGFATGFAYQANMGEVKIQTRHKAAWVYIDGGLAGQADRLKSMWLDPGVYSLEMRDGNRNYTQRIYVLSGKTLRITPELAEQTARP